MLRTCVACGRKTDGNELARVIRAPSGQIVVDWRRNLKGRGAHVCPRRKCLERALEGRLFDRAFKGSVITPGAEELLSAMRIALNRQIETLVRSGCAARLIGVGATAAEQALKHGEARCLVIAKDAARIHQLVDSADRAGAPVIYVESKERLGAYAGRAAAGQMAVLNQKLATALSRAFDRLEMLD